MQPIKCMAVRKEAEVGEGAENANYCFPTQNSKLRPESPIVGKIKREYVYLSI